MKTVRVRKGTPRPMPEPPTPTHLQRAFLLGSPVRTPSAATPARWAPGSVVRVMPETSPGVRPELAESIPCAYVVSYLLSPLLLPKGKRPTLVRAGLKRAAPGAALRAAADDSTAAAAAAAAADDPSAAGGGSAAAAAAVSPLGDPRAGAPKAARVAVGASTSRTRRRRAHRYRPPSAPSRAPSASRNRPRPSRLRHLSPPAPHPLRPRPRRCARARRRRMTPQHTPFGRCPAGFCGGGR